MSGRTDACRSGRATGRPASLARSGLALCALLAVEAHGQTAPAFGLGAWDGSVELDYLADHQSVTSNGGGDATSRRQRFTERMTIANRGFYVLDPLLFQGNLSLTLGELQDRDDYNGGRLWTHNRLTGYAFDSTFLAEKPLSGILFANRNQTYFTQSFSRTDATFENYGTGLRLNEDSVLTNWDVRHFTSTLRVEHQHLDETTLNDLGPSFVRNEARDIATYQGHNGFETGDVDWRYEHTDFKNIPFPVGNYRSDNANLNYSTDFGPNLSRRADTNLSYSGRSGATPTSLFIADQHLLIDHYSNLSTDYRYQYTHQDTGAPPGMQAQKTTAQLGSFLVRHELGRNLTTTGSASAFHIDVPTGKRDSDGAQLGFAYRRSLPWNGNVFVSLGGRGQLDRNDLVSSVVVVTDESHNAPSPIGAGSGFQLAQSFVIPSSILVLDNRGGARVPTTLGIDYDILQVGSFVQIVPLLGSAIIQPGDPLLVSYDYSVNPSIKYRTVSQWANVTVDLRWIALSVGHEQSDQTLLSGQDNGYLQNLRRDSAQVDLRGTWAVLQNQATAAVVRYDSTFLVYTQQRYSEFLSYRPLRTVTLTLSADDTLTDYTLPAHQTDWRSARLGADWFAGGGWTVTGLASWRTYRDTLQPTQTIKEASVKARLDYGKLTFVSTFAAAQQSQGGNQTTTWRLELTAIRRF